MVDRRSAGHFRGHLLSNRIRRHTRLVGLLFPQPRARHKLHQPGAGCFLLRLGRGRHRDLLWLPNYYASHGIYEAHDDRVHVHTQSVGHRDCVQLQSVYQLCGHEPPD